MTGACGSADVARPTPPEERLACLDLLRGFALFGILVVNFPLMASPYEAQYGTLAAVLRRWTYWRREV